MISCAKFALRRALTGCALVAAATGCSAEADVDAGTDSIGQAAQNLTIDERRSLVVTEQAILARFSFERVMTQLASQANVPGVGALQLFQQWWDTQNPTPGVYAGAHCDNQADPVLGTVINGYPYFCRDGAEGAQVSCNPFTVGSACAYIPIGLFNRFDQAPENGAHCGEYRIVYAKQSGIASTSDRNLLIFEAVLPNPHPQQGLKGCQQVVDTWYDLSNQNNVQSRADALEDFYFDGQGAVGPVVSISNFGDNPTGVGQVRTNQFVNTTTGWSLREFKLYRTCSGNSCSAFRFVPVTNKNNPFGPLFAPASSLTQAAAFRSFFPTQVAKLTAGSAAGLDMSTPDVFNTAQSQASGSTASEMRYPDHFTTGASVLRSALQTELTAAGSALTPDDVVKRAQTQTCAGCHRLSNNVDLGGGVVWPPSLGFTHVTERETETVDGQVRFRISDTLINHLLPARKVIFENFLNDRPRPSRGPTHPLGASTTHG